MNNRVNSSNAYANKGTSLVLSLCVHTMLHMHMKEVDNS